MREPRSIRNPTITLSIFRARWAFNEFLSRYCGRLSGDPSLESAFASPDTGRDAVVVVLMIFIDIILPRSPNPLQQQRPHCRYPCRDLGIEKLSLMFSWGLAGAVANRTFIVAVFIPGIFKHFWGCPNRFISLLPEQQGCGPR